MQTASKIQLVTLQFVNCHADAVSPVNESDMNQMLKEHILILYKLSLVTHWLLSKSKYVCVCFLLQ